MFLNTKNAALPAFLLGAVLVLSAVACKKEQTGDLLEAQKKAIQLALQSNNHLVNGTVQMGQGAQEKGAGLADSEASDRCGSVTAAPLDPALFPKVITFDWATGCTDWAGVTRAGAFTLSLDKLWAAGTTSSVTYNNFTQDAVTMNGSLSLSNVSNNLGLGWKVQAGNLTRTDASGTSTLTGALEFKQTQGALTFWDWQDDVHEVTGTTAYTLGTGEAGSLTILTPLVKKNNCAWVSKGTATITVDGETFSIDYGNGTCDNKAMVTYNGQTFEITL
jgi:hypothetical protein